MNASGHYTDPNFTKLKGAPWPSESQLAQIHSLKVGNAFAKMDKPGRKRIEVFQVDDNRCVIVRMDKSGPSTWISSRSARWFAEANRIPPIGEAIA